MKYFIRTTNERILNESYNQLEYEKLVDYNHQPVTSFINQLDYISEWDSILLEDDVLLCSDFKNIIEGVIKEYPDTIINFFTRPQEYFTTHYNDYFVYNQCTYYPKGVAKDLADEMRRIYRLKPNLQYDVLENIALEKLGISHLQYRPCIVQHIDEKSLIQSKHCHKRRSPYFIDYLKELNIDYNEAFKVENRKKLKEKLERSFK